MSNTLTEEQAKSVTEQVYKIVEEDKGSHTLESFLAVNQKLNQELRGKDLTPEEVAIFTAFHNQNKDN